MNSQFLRDLDRLLRPIKIKVANAIARAVVSNVSNAGKLQTLQAAVLDGEVIDDAENFQSYGFTSVPFPGAEAVIVFPNGDRQHGLVVAVADRRYRPRNWEPGEVGLYTDEAGHTVRLRRGKITTFEGDLIELGGIGAAESAVLGDAFKAEYDPHVHPTPMGPSGITTPLTAAVLSIKTKLDV